MDVKLVVFNKDGQRKDFPLGEGKTILGRAEDCHLRIPVGSVSRRHCELTVGPDAVTLRDLGSSNGTFVNNERVTEERQLSAGDRMVLGPVVFTVQVDGQPEQIEPIQTRGQQLAEAGGAEQVDLEAEVLAGGEASEDAALEIPREDDDADPISALEALASDETEDEDQGEKQDRKTGDQGP